MIIILLRVESLHYLRLSLSIGRIDPSSYPKQSSLNYEIFLQKSEFYFEKFDFIDGKDECDHIMQLGHHFKLFFHLLNDLTNLFSRNQTSSIWRSQASTSELLSFLEIRLFIVVFPAKRPWSSTPKERCFSISFSLEAWHLSLCSIACRKVLSTQNFNLFLPLVDLP